MQKTTNQTQSNAKTPVGTGKHVLQKTRLQQSDIPPHQTLQATRLRAHEQTPVPALRRCRNNGTFDMNSDHKAAMVRIKLPTDHKTQIKHSTKKKAKKQGSRDNSRTNWSEHTVDVYPSTPGTRPQHDDQPSSTTGCFFD